MPKAGACGPGGSVPAPRQRVNLWCPHNTVPRRPSSAARSNRARLWLDSSTHVGVASGHTAAPPRPICRRSTATAVSHLIVQSPPDPHRRLRRAGGVSPPHANPVSTYLVARVFTTTDALPRRAAVTRHGAVSPQPEQKPEPAANDFHLSWPQARPYPAAGLGEVRRHVCISTSKIRYSRTHGKIHM